MNIYILRHGETDWNKKKLLQGQTDTDLNEYGRELARETAKGLKDIEFDYVFSSPLKRAYETAKLALGERNIDIITDERLKEVSFGDFEGMPADKRPEEFDKFFSAPGEYKAVNGAESYEKLCARTKAFLDEVIIPLEEKEKDCTVLISGHGAMNKSLMLNIMGREIKDIWAPPFPKNCSTCLVTLIDGVFSVVYENKIYYN